MRAFDRRRNSARGGRCVSTTDGYARHAGDGVRPAREAVTIATSRAPFQATPYGTAGVRRIGRPGVTASMCEQHRPRVGMQVRWDDPGREARFRLVRRAQRQGNADQDGRRLAGRWPPGHRSQNLVVRRSGHHGVRRHGVGVRHVRGPLRAPPQPTGVTQPTRATPPFRATANAHRRCLPHLRGLCDTVIRPRRARWCLHLANERFHLRRQPQACDRLRAIRSSRSGRPIAPA